jgi:hypothetical protein
LPFELVTQQILLFAFPQVLLASHLRTGFLHSFGSVPSVTAPFSTCFAHFLYLPCESAALQSQAADMTARTLSIAVRSVHVALLHTAPAVPDRDKTSARGRTSHGSTRMSSR